MIKKTLERDLTKVLKSLSFPTTDIVLSLSQNSRFGDYTTNTALQLAKLNLENGKQSAADIANKILEKFPKTDYLEKVEVAGPGFINFFIKPEKFAEELQVVLVKGEKFGKGEQGKNSEVQVEFVSANPTGPLTLANGRGGAIGDTLANVLAFLGYKVDREYYVNDTGNQVRLLGESILAAAGKASSQETHYKGEYVKELVERFKDKLGLDPQQLGHLAADYFLEHEIKPAISKLNIKFDHFYSERSVYERGLIEETIIDLKEKGATYEKDNALWFKSSEFGDEKDRVLMTSDNERGRIEPTYFLADIAHHLDDLKRGYLRRINILGADHHGYVIRIKGAIESLGYGGKIEVVLMQMVKLFKGGQEVRMSKRAGNFVTLDELLELISADVARFFFLMYSPSTQIGFNLDLAKEESNKNPVYYVQYAHARMANILNKTEKQSKKPDFNLLTQPTEGELIKHLVSFPDLLEEIGVSLEVHKLTTFAIKLSDLFHKFYETCRVLNAETDPLKDARLGLVRAAKTILGSNLKLLGVTAPERM